MSRDNALVRMFTRRALLVGGAQLSLLAGLAARLYWLQIVQGANYRTLAEENRISLRLNAAPRGQIVDRSGVLLAMNAQNYRLVARPEQLVEPLEVMLARVAALIPLSPEEQQAILTERRQNRVATILVRDNITWEDVAKLALHTGDLPGFDIETGELRSYPYGTVLAHVLGYVGVVTPDDVKTNKDPTLTIPGLHLGRNGLEKVYDVVLRGQAGTIQLETDAHGRIVRELKRHPPQNGKPLTLSIDIGLQELAAQRLSTTESASAVVLDVKTGAIHAMVTTPSFDPNLFSGGIPKRAWNALNADEHHPLLNKAIGGLYAPGSTFKVVTALAALEAAVIDPKTTVHCPGWYTLGNRRFHCWKKGGHGNVNFIQAMAGSCDTYFYEIGSRVGIDRLQAMGLRLGLGERTGVDLPHERPGLMPGRAWKRTRYNAPWHPGETLITAIGQGSVLTTPLQLAVLIAQIVNGGYKITPHLVLDDPARDSPLALPSLGISEESLSLVRDAMRAVVMEPWGTAHGARILEEDLAMAGKTGTAQVRRISTAERATGVRSNDELPWRERDHALFIGFAPIDDPQFAVAVVVEHGGSGAHTAAPLARDLLRACQLRANNPPDRN